MFFVDIAPRADACPEVMSKYYYIKSPIFGIFRDANG